MPEPIGDLDDVRAIQLGVSLQALAALDDSALEEMISWALPERVRTGNRLWSQGGSGDT